MRQADRLLHTQNIYLSVLAIIGTGYLLYTSRSFMIPFTIAVLLGVLFSPVLSFLSKKGIPESFGSLIIFIGIFIFFTIFGVIVFQSISSVASQLGKYEKQLKEIITHLSEFTEKNFDVNLREELLEVGSQNFFENGLPQALINTINSSVGSFVGFFSNLLVMLLFLMFILLSRNLLREKIFKFMASQDVENSMSEEIVESISLQIQNYLFLKTLISIFTGLAVWLVAILFGLDLPIVWGFLAFIMNYIPSIGPIVAAVPPILLSFFQFYHQWEIALIISIAMVLIQFVSGNIVEPKIMGDRLNLNILVVLLCLFMWGMIWGFAGMVLSVPLTASINIILNHTSRYKHISILLSN